MKLTKIKEKDILKDKSFDLYSDSVNIEEKIPGINQQRLISGINTTGGGGSIKHKLLLRNSSFGTGTYNITGFGFKPTAYSIVAWKNGFSGNPAFSIGGADGTITQALNVQNSDSNTTSAVIRVRDGDLSQQTRALHVGFISDGIQLHFTHSAFDIYIMITAYK